MSRHFGADARRQAEAEADDEARYQSDVAGLALGLAEDTGDRSCDDGLIAEAKAFCVATINRLGHKLYLFRAVQALTCKSCGGSIAVDELFTSVYACEPSSVEFGFCTGCRFFRMPKGVKPWALTWLGRRSGMYGGR